MNLIADLHTHTLVSNHALNSITEMARRAKELGLFALAITDHAPEMPDAPHPWYFYTLSTLPDKIEDIWLLKGVEANVRDIEGHLDAIVDEIAFDWVIASIHSDVLQTKLTTSQATELWINVANNEKVDMIGHSELQRYKYDYETVAKVFAQTGKVIEMNVNSAKVRPGNEENLKQLAIACKKAGAKIAVNSDAHSIYHMGCEAKVLQMLKEIDFPQELVMNASKQQLIATLQEHRCSVAAKMEDEQ